MKDKICATLTKDHIYICNGGVIGRSGENECTQLEITLDECLCDKWVYIDFVKPDGTTYKTPKLDIVDNKVIYDIPNVLLDQKGTLKVQVVLQNEEGEIWKSNIKTYGVNPSINATDDIPNQEDFITEAQRLLNEVEEGLTPTIGENENWFICGKDTGMPSRGTQGEKGEKGDAGSVKFIIANELPSEDIDDSAIYMIPAGATTEGNTYEEYIYVNGVWESLGSANVNVDLADYVKNTDYSTIDKAGIVKSTGSGRGIHISNVDGSISLAVPTQAELLNKNVNKAVLVKDIDNAIKIGMTTNTEEWTEEEKTSARELLGAVGDTDFATNDNAGVIKVTPYSSGLSVNNGQLMITSATSNNIQAKSDTRKPLTCHTIDTTVKVGVTTNTIELTDEEKASACNWLGAIKGTDVADNNNFGVVKTNNNYGIQSENGVLYIRRASSNEIDFRHQWAPITPANLEYAVKSGLTTNSLEWTEEEKQSARSLLGVSDEEWKVCITEEIGTEDDVSLIEFEGLDDYNEFMLIVMCPWVGDGLSTPPTAITLINGTQVEKDWYNFQQKSTSIYNVLKAKRIKDNDYEIEAYTGTYGSTRFQSNTKIQAIFNETISKMGFELSAPLLTGGYSKKCIIKYYAR